MLTILPYLALASQSSPSIDIDPLLLVEAAEVWSVIGRPNNPVWPGWDARSTPILIYFPGKQDVLVNHPKPPRGFVRYSGRIRCPIGPIYVRNGQTIMDLDGQNTSTEINGVESLVVADTLSIRRQWVEGMAGAIAAAPNDVHKIVTSNLFPDPYGQMTTFAHEAFHVYQTKRAPGKGPNEMELASYPSLSVENNVGLALESDFLAAAVTATTEREVRDNAAKWLAVRDWRRSFIGKEASDYEDAGEFIEGTAVYVQYRILQAFEHSEPTPQMWLVQGFHGFSDLSVVRNDLIQRMRGMMSGSTGVNGDLYGASPVRFRLYFSGMAIGALLDRLGSDWHDAIFKPGVSLTGLVRAAIRPTVDDSRSALEAVKATPRFIDLTAQKTKLAEDGRAYCAREIAKFDSAPGQLVIDYSLLKDSDVALRFTPFGILRIDNDKTLFRLIPIEGHVGKTSFFEENALPVLKDAKLKRIEFQLTAAIDPKAIAAQIGSPDLEDHGFKADRMLLPGAELRNVRGTLRLAGGTLTIRLEPYSSSALAVNENGATVLPAR
jgi:hypothetical protein